MVLIFSLASEYCEQTVTTHKFRYAAEQDCWLCPLCALPWTAPCAPPQSASARHRRVDVRVWGTSRACERALHLSHSRWKLSASANLWSPVVRKRQGREPCTPIPKRSRSRLDLPGSTESRSMNAMQTEIALAQSWAPLAHWSKGTQPFSIGVHWEAPLQYVLVGILAAQRNYSQSHDFGWLDPGALLHFSLGGDSIVTTLSALTSGRNTASTSGIGFHASIGRIDVWDAQNKGPGGLCEEQR